VNTHHTIKPSAQCATAAQTAAGIMARISRAFTYCDRKIWMGLYKTYVQPHLEFAVEAWSPWEQFRHCLERIQEKAVKQVNGLLGKTYEERLTELGIESLEKRWMRLVLIKTFKILRGHENVEPSTWF
jgi:ribonuclease P/MRP protein subunit RPP40